MRILITGITGRIGANLAAALLRDGHQVRGLVWARDPRVEKLGHLDVELLDGTITEPDDVKRAIAGSDAVYHLAGPFRAGCLSPSRSISRSTSQAPSTCSRRRGARTRSSISSWRARTRSTDRWKAAPS